MRRQESDDCELLFARNFRRTTRMILVVFSTNIPDTFSQQSPLRVGTVTVFRHIG